MFAANLGNDELQVCLDSNNVQPEEGYKDKNKLLKLKSCWHRPMTDNL